MLSFLVRLPNDTRFNNEKKQEVVLNIMTLFMILGETMPSKLPSLLGLLSGIELVINAMGDNVVNDAMQILFQKCKLINENVMKKKNDGMQVIVMLVFNLVICYYS